MNIISKLTLFVLEIDVDFEVSVLNEIPSLRVVLIATGTLIWVVVGNFSVLLTVAKYLLIIA
jgi:hypothetical protein